MKQLKDFIVESQDFVFDANNFNKDLLAGLLVYISSKFNGDKSADNLIIDKYGTHTDYTFNIKLQVNGKGQIKVNANNVILKCIGQIVESTIKGILNENASFKLSLPNGLVDISIEDHENNNDSYDFILNGADGWGSAKFEVKAVRSTDEKKMRNNVNISAAEKEANDFFLIVEYTLSENTVHIPAMYIFGKNDKIMPMKLSDGDEKVYKRGHLTKAQLDAAIKHI